MSIDVEKKKEYFTIKIPKPRNLERIFYILIIVVLLFFLFVHNPFPRLTCGSCVGNSDLTAAAVDNSGTDDTDSELSATGDDAGEDTEKTAEEIAAEEAVKEAAKKAEEEAAAKKAEEEAALKAEEEATTMTAKKGQIKYTILDVETVIKNKGKASEFGKITGVTYKVENNKKEYDDFTLKVYAFDSKTTELSDLLRAEDSYSIGEGEIIEETIELKSGSFKDLTIEKDLKIKFFDGAKWLYTADHKFTIK